MNFDYSQANIIQGRANQDQARENPNTFATDSGAENVRQTTDLDRPRQRMAGQMGNRIMEYLQDPNERMRTDSWMDMFALSTPGYEFNQVKMAMGPNKKDNA